MLHAALSKDKNTLTLSYVHVVESPSTAF